MGYSPEAIRSMRSFATWAYRGNPGAASPLEFATPFVFISDTFRESMCACWPIRPEATAEPVRQHRATAIIFTYIEPEELTRELMALNMYGPNGLRRGLR